MIERVIDLVCQNARPGSGTNLEGFVTDADFYLWKSGFLDAIRVRQTDRPQRMLEIEATVTDKAQSLQEVAWALREAWTNLAYADFEASSCRWYREGTVLDFVTIMRERGVFVTGRMFATGTSQAELVARFVRDFGPMYGELQSLSEE